MTTASIHDFDVEVADRAPGFNLPQRMGRALWAPMWLMALGFFLAGTITGIVRANAIAEGAPASSIQALGHLGPGLQFLGFMAVFAAISFAIARILGIFREGGGQVQEATGRRVETLEMPMTTKVFILLMTLAMMALIVVSIVHFAYAAATAAGSITVEASRRAAETLEGIRRFATALYLFAITLGLATITKVLRFQAIRLRELPDTARRT